MGRGSKRRQFPRGWGQILKVFFSRDFEARIIVFIDDLTLRERVQISASGHADADQLGADFFRFHFQLVPILSVPIETESALFKIPYRAN